MKAIFVALACLLSVAATNVQAGLLKSIGSKTTLGIGVLAAGTAIKAYKDNNCHLIFNPETNKKNVVCDKSTPYSVDAFPIEPGSDVVGLVDRVSTTKELRKNLNEELQMSAAPGAPPPEDPEDCEAHHIVPQAENRAWAKEFVDGARDALEGCVDMDSAENGIWLPKNDKGTAQCTGSNHKKVHTQSYYKDISKRLTDANEVNGCSSVRSELKLIKEELFQGKLWKLPK